MRIWLWLIGLVGLLTGALAIAQGPALPPSTQSPVAAVPTTAQSQPDGDAARSLSASDLTVWLDGYMPYALQSGDIAGAVVTVVKDGRLIAAKGYGYADTAKRKPVDPATTLFRPGSISKLFTWTAVMQQVEAGKIDLDADINRYLDFKIPPRDGQPITMRQVMTHTAGFEDTAKDLISYDPKAVQTLGAYLKSWVPHRIFDAGTTPAYSNWATSLAGYVVERVSGMPFDDYLDRRIFGPIDMRTATFRQPLPASLKPLMATGYPRASGPAEGFEIVIPFPAGSLSASGVDMAKFMAAHLQGGKGLLQPATAAMMHDSPLDRVNPLSLIPPLNRMELGFFETNINGREVIAHLGDTQNFHSSMHLFMKEGVGFYVSFNSAGKEGAVGALRWQLFQDFADRYFPSDTKDDRVDAKSAREHAKMMVGLWQSSRRSASGFTDALNLVGQTKITLDKDGGLLIPALTRPGGGVQKWVEIAPFVWRDRHGHDRIAAKIIDGKVARWSFELGAPFMVFERVPAGRSSGWIFPALFASLGVLLLTVLFWPVTWFTRWRYGAPLAVTGHARTAYRATRIMTLLVIALLVGWAIFISAAFSDLDLLSSKSDWLVWLLQIGGAIVFVGAVGVAAWNAWLTWRDGRKWPAKLWSVVVVLAALVALYVASTFHLLAMSANY